MAEPPRGFVSGGFGGVVPPGGHLRVVRGDATPEELAALVATLAAIAAARTAADATAQAKPARGNWNAPARLLRAPVYPAAGGWRRSALP